jgi:small GTP-binding protein
MDTSNSMELRTKHKVAFLGDPAVGKTSIISQFIHGKFSTSHNPTIGIDYLSKIMNLGDRSIRLQIWDTAG